MWPRAATAFSFIRKDIRWLSAVTTLQRHPHLHSPSARLLSPRIYVAVRPTSLSTPSSLSGVVRKRRAATLDGKALEGAEATQNTWTTHAAFEIVLAEASGAPPVRLEVRATPSRSETARLQLKFDMSNVNQGDTEGEEPPLAVVDSLLKDLHSALRAIDVDLPNTDDDDIMVVAGRFLVGIPNCPQFTLELLRVMYSGPTSSAQTAHALICDALMLKVTPVFKADRLMALRFSRLAGLTSGGEHRIRARIEISRNEITDSGLQVSIELKSVALRRLLARFRRLGGDVTLGGLTLAVHEFDDIGQPSHINFSRHLLNYAFGQCLALPYLLAFSQSRLDDLVQKLNPRREGRVVKAWLKRHNHSDASAQQRSFMSFARRDVARSSARLSRGEAEALRERFLEHNVNLDLPLPACLACQRAIASLGLADRASRQLSTALERGDGAPIGELYLKAHRIGGTQMAAIAHALFIDVAPSKWSQIYSEWRSLRLNRRRARSTETPSPAGRSNRRVVGRAER